MTSLANLHLDLQIYVVALGRFFNSIRLGCPISCWYLDINMLNIQYYVYVFSLKSISIEKKHEPLPIKDLNKSSLITYLALFSLSYWASNLS